MLQHSARFLALLALLALPSTLHADEPKPIATADAVQEAFVRVAERLAPSVVTIYCERLPSVPHIDPKTGQPEAKTAPDDDDDPDDAPQPGDDPNATRTSLGTGVIVRADGTILTNYHVVRGADVVRVVFDPASERPDRPLAQVVGYDEESDLAVLKVPRSGLTAANFADSDKVRIGEWAMAIGAPFDQPQTVTVGIVSAKSRHLEKKGRVQLQDFLQTDASINPGNSGGPLIDLEGNVIGINTAILSPSRFNVGIGFSVPSNTIKRLLPILMSGKSVQRGFLGIQYVRIDDAVAKEFGVAGGMQIGALAKKNGAFIGPAKEAGLQEDDIITAVDGVPIRTSDQFRGIVSQATPGTALKFSITRPGGDKIENFDTTVVLGDWNTQFAPKTTPVALPLPKTPPAPTLGLEVENADKLTASDKKRFALDAGDKGAVITRVVPGSSADESDLRAGFRIVRVRIGGIWQAVPNAATWQKIERDATPGTPILLQLRDRDDVSVYKVVSRPAATVPATPPATGATG